MKKLLISLAILWVLGISGALLAYSYNPASTGKPDDIVLSKPSPGNDLHTVSRGH